jgi:hypothetical protein
VTLPSHLTTVRSSRLSPSSSKRSNVPLLEGSQTPHARRRLYDPGQNRGVVIIALSFPNTDIRMNQTVHSLNTRRSPDFQFRSCDPSLTCRFTMSTFWR